ncbi:MAG: ribokinase [Anaerolineae bacterium]|nr:ribokinase [Anaerolineae bacterium]MCB0177454.1 ribokinase [Anaerolineae bacterium]MCB9104693.1 ribokinase [Anaerolineales bacterium]
MTILVFGSINMDLVIRTPRLPAPGETIIGHEFFTAGGGKGANQAVAAARLAAPTKMIGRVGGDSFGVTLLQQLAESNVDVDSVFVDESVASGVAIIAVDDAAQNNIIIASGANRQVDQTDLERLSHHMPQAKVLLLQLEIPLDMIVAAAKLARQHNVTVILDPAPAQALPAELYPLIDIITPNEIEAGQLVDFPIKTQEDAQHAAQRLLARGVKTAVIKMGAVGVVYATAESTDFVPAFSVQAVDTVAAGDAFNGGLAAGLGEGLALPQAVRWGAATGALSATKAGAQPSMPTRAEFEAFLASSQ